MNFLKENALSHSIERKKAVPAITTVCMEAESFFLCNGVDFIFKSPL